MRQSRKEKRGEKKNFFVEQSDSISACLFPFLCVRICGIKKKRKRNTDMDDDDCTGNKGDHDFGRKRKEEKRREEGKCSGFPLIRWRKCKRKKEISSELCLVMYFEACRLDIMKAVIKLCLIYDYVICEAPCSFPPKFPRPPHTPPPQQHLLAYLIPPFFASPTFAFSVFPNHDSSHQLFFFCLPPEEKP